MSTIDFDREAFCEYLRRTPYMEEKFLVRALSDGNFEMLEYFPRFQSKEEEHITGKTARHLLECMYYEFDEDDPNVQERFYLCLDRIIDGLVQLQYEESKKTFIFKSVDQIDYKLKDCFARVDEYNSKFQFQMFVDRIVYDLKDKTIQKPYFQEISRLYQLYLKNPRLDHEETTPFYNDILNRQRANFFQSEKQQMIEYLTAKLPYTKKKERSRELSVQLKKVDECFSRGLYEELDTTEEELRKQLSDFDFYLNQLKGLRKEKVVISKQQHEELLTLFFSGKLGEDTIEEVLPTASRKAVKLILDKYTQVKIPLAEDITVSPDELPDLELGYHYNNYKIASQERYYYKLIQFVSSLTEEVGLDILSHQKEIQPLLPILAFTGYFPILDSSLMQSLFRNYPRICRRLASAEENDIDELLWFSSHFDKATILAQAYDGADDITIAALGKDATEKIIVSDSITSRNPTHYLDVYKKMLSKEVTYIPPVYGEYLDYYYESAHVADPMRLLIGKNCNFSCIGPGGAGEVAYEQVLTKPQADVIMVKRKETDEFYARILCFRNGNYIAMAPIYSQEGLTFPLYDASFLKPIADSMLIQAKEQNDSLNYVFMSRDIDLLDDSFSTYCSQLLTEPVLPHADLDQMAYLIGGNEQNIELDALVKEICSYPVRRDIVKDKLQVEESHFARLQALDVLLTEDHELKEEKARAFELVSKDIYEELLVGQDWYLGIRENGMVEEVVLPVSSEQQKKEVAIAREYFDSVYSVDTVDSRKDRGGK